MGKLGPRDVFVSSFGKFGPSDGFMRVVFSLLAQYDVGASISTTGTTRRTDEGGVAVGETMCQRQLSRHVAVI